MTLLKSTIVSVVVVLVLLLAGPRKATSQAEPFHLLEATVEDVHNAYTSGTLTARQLVRLYLDRIEAYDKKGPNINAIITLNPDALRDADRLDAAFKNSGLTAPLHGIPIIVKDQFDVKGMPTTLGSILFKDYYPDKDAFVTEKLRKAGAIILGKATLGELGGGDTHGFCLARRETRTRWSERQAVPRAVPVQVCPRISQHWVSDRKGLPRSGGPPHGTASWA